jgi:hypothetical protein
MKRGNRHKKLSTRTTLRGLAVPTLAAFLAVGCGGSSIALNTGGSSGRGSGGGGSGGRGSGQNGGVSGTYGDGTVSGVGGLRGSGEGSSATADSGISPDSGSATRVPTNHRPTMTSCPQGRGPGLSISTTGSCTQTGCLQDSDCTSGINGRCTNGPFACSAGCSYDECLSDADCPGNVPCECRSSGSDPMRNFCATQSYCRIDADCGPDGYCSPSLLSLVQNDGYSICDDGTTGHFCHTPNDLCTDDSDCNQGTCNFDLKSQSWSCGLCLPPL